MAAALRRLLLLAGCVLWVLSSSLLAGAHAHSYTEEANTGEWGDVNFAFVDPDELRNAGHNITVLNADPLIVQFEDFLGTEEMEALRALGEPHLKRSTGGLTREISDYRTSSTAWLVPDVVDNDPQRKPIVRHLEQRIAEVIGLPIENQEHFQVLRYEPGQFYKTHNDYIAEQGKMPCGVRVATFFIYLNDVEEGGGTAFPKLDLVVQPKPGRAVLWYSVRAPNDLRIDPRTDHEAQSVIRGVKWGSNKWIHIGNFADNWRVGKTG